MKAPMNFIVMTEAMHQEMVERLGKLEALLAKTTRTAERYFSLNETLQILKVSKKTLQKLRDHRHIGFVQFGRSILFPQAEVEAFLKRNHIKSRFPSSIQRP